MSKPKILFVAMAVIILSFSFVLRQIHFQPTLMKNSTDNNCLPAVTAGLETPPVSAPAPSQTKVPAKTTVSAPATKPVADPGTQPEPEPANETTPKPAEEPAPPPKEDKPATSADMQRILELINAERAKAGIAALQMKQELTKVAQIKADDMVDNNYFSHNSPTYG
jgi:uncharacterized protein YkwD